MTIQELGGFPWEEILTRALHALACGFLVLTAAGFAWAAACAAAAAVSAQCSRFAAWYRRTPKVLVLLVLLGFAEAVEIGGSKGTLDGLPGEPADDPPASVSQTRLTAPCAAQSAAAATPSYLMPSLSGGFVPPDRYTNTLSQAQYDACFALTSVTSAVHDFEVPPGAEATDYIPSHGVHDEAYWIPLPSGFNSGGLEDGSRFVAAVCAAPSGAVLLDGLPGRAAPSEPVFAGAETNRALSVLQTPSGLLPPGGRLWSADTTNGNTLITWRNLMLGRLAGAGADLQCELFPNGDFTYYIHPHADADLSAVTNWLVAAQDAGGGEAYAFAANAPLSPAVPANGATLELRWTAFGRLDPSVPDTDSDGLTDWEELMVYRTSVREWDTDGDGLSDGEEVLRYGTDPLRADSTGGGTNDFWRVVDANALTNAPWMEGGDGLALLTLETRLDGAEGCLAALRVGDVLVPVLPGTALVSRVAVPLDEAVPVALVPAPGSEGASASVTVVDCDALGVLSDPGDIFTFPQPAQRNARPSLAALPAAAAPFNVRTATARLLSCTLSPGLLCPHTGRGTLSLSVGTSLTDADGIAAVGLVDGETDTTPVPTKTVTEALLLERNPWLAGAASGSYEVAYTALVYTAAAEGYKAFPLVRRAVPAHYCVFAGAGASPPGDGTPGSCPCCTNQVCPCRCASPGACACATCAHPYETDAPTNGAGAAQGTCVRDRGPQLLTAGGAADRVAAGPQNADGSSGDGTCAYCGCPHAPGSSGSATLAAAAWRRTAGLASSPDGLPTNGYFAVVGVSPSEKAGGDVFTWRAGPVYSRGRYTVVSLGAVFANAAPDAAPRVQVGHTNAFLIRTAVPADGGGTLAFAYNPFYAGVSVRNRQTGLYDPLPVLDSVPASDWMGTYASTNTFEAEARYVATAAGDHAFGITYALPDHTPGSVATNIAFAAVRIQSEPVTSDLATGGYVYNSSGLPLGGDGRFRIAVAEGTVPDADIAWTVKEGGVSFANGNTGPEVAVHAAALGAFTLEADVKGLVITPPNVRPFFTGVVLPAVTVPVTVFIVCDNDGGNQARNPSAISGLLTDANTILRQRGITLAQNGTNNFIRRTAWLNHTNALAQVSPDIDEMMDTVNSMGNAVELYFVQSLTQPDLAGARRPKGIAVAGGAGAGRTIAHEVLHDCGTGTVGMEDIYPVRNDSETDTDPIPGLVSQERLSADWGGGYYSPELTQRELVDRLIMRSGGYDDPSQGSSLDLPSGPIFGYHDSTSNGVTTRVLGPAAVGQNACTGTPGSW